MNYQQKLINEFEKKVNKELTKLEEIKNQEERMCKLEVLYNFHKVFTNYEELEPTFKKFFVEKERKEKFGGKEDDER